MSAAEVETYKAGEGVNYSFNGDTYPATVVRATPSRVWVKLDGVRAKGDSRVFLVGEASRQGEGERLFTRRRDGRFRSAGHGTWTLGKGRESRLSREF